MFLVSQNTTKFKITDDSGFLAIVNCDKYKSFVNEDWEFAKFLNHFVDEMNNEALIIWATPGEREWSVVFSDKRSDHKSSKEFKSTLTVTAGQIFLTNYEDLTMAAQFASEKIPATHNSDLFINLDNGKYNFTIRQMFDDNDYDHDSLDKIDFEIIIEPNIEAVTEKIANVHCLT